MRASNNEVPGSSGSGNAQFGASASADALKGLGGAVAIVSEYVTPDDGRNETRWYCLTLVVILLFCGLALTLNQQQRTATPQYLELSTQAKSLLTALRNAGDEILFLLPESGALAEGLPDVASLQAEGVPPFAQEAMSADLPQYQWQRLPGACYLGQPLSTSAELHTHADPQAAPLQPSFLLKLQPSAAGNQVAVYWRLMEPATAVACDSMTHWQAYLE